MYIYTYIIPLIYHYSTVISAAHAEASHASYLVEARRIRYSIIGGLNCSKHSL